MNGKNFQKMLKDGMDREIETKAATDAILSLRKMHGENNLAEEYAEDLIDIRTRFQDIQSAVKSIEDPMVQDVMIARYIHNLTWEDVAAVCHMSVAHAHRLHKKGLLELEVKTID
ncbi:MAG: hypothetical protein FWB74_02685 [Defluviitaleaceae bacterium]|nr:hypothetical protein [Defluviitaleaceae bacterium]